MEDTPPGHCDLCGNPTSMTYGGGTFCAHCVLTVCGRCWKARLVKTWSRWRLRKPLLLRCPNCGWKKRVRG